MTDLKRIFTNQMVSSICWGVVQSLTLLSIPDLIMHFYRPFPFPEWMCYIQIILRNALAIRFLLLIDAVVIARYILQFWMKNPFNFQDDFWCLFVNIWIGAFRYISIAFSFFAFNKYYLLPNGGKCSPRS